MYNAKCNELVTFIQRRLNNKSSGFVLSFDQLVASKRADEAFSSRLNPQIKKKKKQTVLLVGEVISRADICHLLVNIR